MYPSYGAHPRNQDIDTHQKAQLPTLDSWSGNQNTTAMVESKVRKGGGHVGRNKGSKNIGIRRVESKCIEENDDNKRSR